MLQEPASLRRGTQGAYLQAAFLQRADKEEEEVLSDSTSLKKVMHLSYSAVPG